MARIFCYVLGAVFLVIAVWGMLIGGHNHNLIIFGVNMPHNLVHLVSGVFAVLSAWSGESRARLFCFVFGAVYGLVAVLGFMQVPAVVDILNVNQPDNWLHAAIAGGCFVFGGLSAAKKA